MNSRRDTQKTQHGIETATDPTGNHRLPDVETLRKPSTGLKQTYNGSCHAQCEVETLRKPSTGLKQDVEAYCGDAIESRHSENPARD